MRLVLRKGLERVCGGSEEQVEDENRMAPRQSAQFGRQGEPALAGTAPTTDNAAARKIILGGDGHTPVLPTIFPDR